MPTTITDSLPAVLFCSYLIDNEVPCCSEGTVRFGLYLCDKHWKTYWTSALSVDSALKTTLNYYSLDDFPGLCYFVLLPTSGHVKIGFSSTPALLLQRFKDLRRELGTIVPLAVCDGGFIAERYYHTLFAEDRDFSVGNEVFKHSPAIADTILQLGICEAAHEPVSTFRGWVATRV